MVSRITIVKPATINPKRANITTLLGLIWELNRSKFAVAEGCDTDAASGKITISNTESLVYEKETHGRIQFGLARSTASG